MARTLKQSSIYCLTNCTYIRRHWFHSRLTACWGRCFKPYSRVPNSSFDLKLIISFFHSEIDFNVTLLYRRVIFVWLKCNTTFLVNWHYQVLVAVICTRMIDCRYEGWSKSRFIFLCGLIIHTWINLQTDLNMEITQALDIYTCRIIHSTQSNVFHKGM